MSKRVFCARNKKVVDKRFEWSNLIKNTFWYEKAQDWGTNPGYVSERMGKNDFFIVL